MSSFFQELKRRKVYRVAVAYVIAAGGIIQIASAVFPAWELPNWSLRLVIVLLLAGFPIALILAWAFDVTPSGIQTTPALPMGERGSSTTGHRRRNIFLLGSFGFVVAIVAGFFLLPHVSARKVEKSIAVLPFRNYSGDQNNTYFADGIQDDILTALSRIGDLKVISRTSVMAYRDSALSAPEIGKALGAGAILEGSVRSDGRRVRVNVQLINAANDEHIWANEYDRELNDVFAIQSDLAREIAGALQAKLSPGEKARMSRKPTENGEAYLAFVEAHNLQLAVEDIGKLRQAVQLYDRAIQLDPNFVLAIANLSILHSWIFHNFEPSATELDLARRNAERALELQPDSPEGHLARGYFLYYGKRNYEGALAEFALAQRGLPNESNVYLVTGAIQRRQGRWTESTSNLEKAVSLNPNDPWPLQNLFFNYQMQRNFEAANRVLDRALKLNPNSFSLWTLKAQIAVAERGDFSVAENGFATLGEAIRGKGEPDLELAANLGEARANVYLLERKYPEVIATVNQLPKAKLESRPHGFIGARLFAGIAYEKLGRGAEAQAAFTEAKKVAQAALEAAPNEPGRHAALAGVLAFLGDKEAAIAEAKRASELRPESVDAFEGPGITETLAQVYAVTGEKARAIELLDGLLRRPGNLTVALLKIDPVWDGLRDEPAFQKLVAHEERQG